MKYGCLVILSCFLLSSCGREQKQFQQGKLDAENVIDIECADLPPIHIDTTNIQSLEYLPLETTAESLIGEISKIIIKHNRIFIGDFFIAKALFVFDMQGKFLFKVGRRGNGQGEYINLFDFDVFSNGDIYLWDAVVGKFLVYDKNSLYRRDVKMEYKFLSFCIVNDKLYFAPQIRNDGTIASNLALYEYAKKECVTIIPERGEVYDNLHLARYSPYSFFYSDTSVYYTPQFSDVIYVIDSMVHPAIRLNNIQLPPQNVIEQWNTHYDQPPNTLAQYSQYLKGVVYIFETSSYITFSAVMEYHKQIVYCKKTHRNFSVLPATKFFGIDLIIACHSNKFITAFHPEEKHSQLIEREHLLVKEDDNPVLVFFDFKLN
jgi:hypothetical protein